MLAILAFLLHFVMAIAVLATGAFCSGFKTYGPAVETTGP
jgi:hypothetical protein